MVLKTIYFHTKLSELLHSVINVKIEIETKDCGVI